jgi:hypothetical protein
LIVNLSAPVFAPVSGCSIIDIFKANQIG